VSEIRRHLVTGDPILYAPERAARPKWGVGECPFCPGNEHETPPEIAHTGEPWRVRVFPNKFPFAEHHEVIVEARDHDAAFESIVHAPEVVSMYIDRYRALRPFGSVALFKNHGAMAGASLPHLHSQMVALPFVPPRISREAGAFARTSECPLCKISRLRDEAPAGLPAPHENESFVMFDPHARMFSGERWIVPKAHISEMSDIDAVDDLAAMLQLAAKSTEGAYNWLFFNFGDAPRAHCYIAIAPRISPVAGFELETGVFVDSL
jgi:UDPglucose--hexose-1-phosphate uridylyltransferase